MKTKIIKYLAAAFILFSVSLSASAQIYVKVRPNPPVVVRPPQPSHVHVWIGHEWEPDGRGYRYSGAHWELAPHEGERYHHGHWYHHPEGYVWIHGEWRKRR